METKKDPIVADLLRGGPHQRGAEMPTLLRAAAKIIDKHLAQMLALEDIEVTNHEKEVLMKAATHFSMFVAMYQDEDSEFRVSWEECEYADHLLPVGPPLKKGE